MDRKTLYIENYGVFIGFSGRAGAFFPNACFQIFHITGMISYKPGYFNN